MRLRFPRLGIRRPGRPTLRLRLALLSSSLVGSTLVVFSLFVYFTEARTLMQEVDRALVDRAQVVARSITVSGTPLGLSLELPDADALAFSGTVVQVVSADGTIQQRSEVLSRLGLALPVSEEALDAARSGQPHLELVTVGGLVLRQYSQPLILARTPVGLIQVARWVGPTEEALTRLRLVLAGGALAIVLVSILLGLLVARAALRPIDRLTREAERIGESQDFGRRVPGSGADEVGRLAGTFNQMLGRLQSAFAALQQANKRLEAALESQRRFVADASHELRTPLTTVRGNASLLGRFDELTPEDRDAVASQIAAEAERMSRLVADLLTLARADAGQLLERRPVALGPLVAAVAQQARVLADGKVAVSVVRLADAEVTGDADALRQLLLILVDNAIKYSQPGGSVTIGLGMEAPRGSNRMARVTVADTGIGIAPEDLPHVFERFYRADRARRTGGTGLGLAIGKWIAEAHGGRIEVESEPGSGSIFTVVIPAVLTEVLPSAEPVLSHSS